MSSFLGSEQPTGLVQEEWGPGGVPWAVWSFRKAVASRRSRRYQHIVETWAAVPLLSACTGDTRGWANAPRNEGAGCNSAKLCGGNVFSFSKYIHAQCLHGQGRCSTITTKIIIHNLFQIHQKYLYFSFRRMGFGTRNRTTDSPLNSTALLMQTPTTHNVIKRFVIDYDVLLNSPSINHFFRTCWVLSFLSRIIFSQQQNISLFFFACLHFFSQVLLCCWVFSIRNC